MTAIKEYGLVFILIPVYLIFAALQLHYFEMKESVDYVDVLSEGVQAIIILAGILISQKIKGSKSYPPIIIGLTIFSFYAITDVLDEFVEQPYYFSHIFEDTFQTIGMLLLLYGGWTWIRLKMAEEEQLRRSNQLKDLFLDILRHDLLNPVGVIRNATELLLEELPDKEELKVIKRSADKLIVMIENAAKLAKLESVQKLEKKKLDLREVIERAVDEVKPMLREAEMVVENRVVQSITINANPVIEEVFTNLLTNAAKYAGEGKRVVIEAEEGVNRVKIMVKDYGPGIPDEDKERIFRRFERKEKGGIKGIGLGLAIVKRIVELHNGKVWVEDNPEGGSIFWVQLPKGRGE